MTTKIVKHLLPLILIFSINIKSSPVWAMNPQEHPESSQRRPDESLGQAFQRYLSKHLHAGRPIDKNKATPLSEARPINELDRSRIPIWTSRTSVARAFEVIRDYRFLNDPLHPVFARRISWIFPDDGCFARAELMNENFGDWNLPVPSKLFIFGELKLKTVFSPKGVVHWWYHVVPVVRMGDQIVILDPAINPLTPLNLLDWVKTMTDDPSKVKVAVCHPTTYTPGRECFVPNDNREEALADQQKYLGMEWERVVELGRDPYKILADEPPWKNK